MLKKSIASICLILALGVLSGCARVTDYDQMVQTSLSRPLAASPNKNKQYLKYYVLPDTGVKETTQLSSLLSIDGQAVMMTLDVSDIIARKYYDQVEVNSRINAEQALYRQQGTYLDRNDVERHFVFSIIASGKQKALVLENGLVTLMGVVDDANLNYVLDSMIVTMRSTEVNEEQVVAYYSNKEIIDYKAIHQDFFNHKVPESGTLLEIYNQLHPDDMITDPSVEQGGE